MLVLELDVLSPPLCQNFIGVNFVGKQVVLGELVHGIKDSSDSSKMSLKQYDIRKLVLIVVGKVDVDLSNLHYLVNNISYKAILINF